MASTSKQERPYALLRSRIEDIVSLCERRNAPTFIGFLDEAEQTVAAQALKHGDQGRFSFFGGYNDAQRRILGYFPEDMPPEEVAYPLVPLLFRFRVGEQLTHRDFLGTLLAQGIKREAVGDILCADDYAVVFVRDEIARYIIEQITKVGGVGVNITAGYDGELPVAHKFLTIQDTITSSRLDTVVKVLMRCAREKAAQAIISGTVSVDHFITDNVSAIVSPPCVISIRGVGRFLIDQIGPPTKKGRLVIVARKCV